MPIMAAGLAFPQYKLESAGPPPSGLPAAIAGTLQKDGSKVVAGNGTAFCELVPLGDSQRAQKR